jgi:hypothetical protein
MECDCVGAVTPSNVKKSGNEYTAHCPTHDDGHKNLSVDLDNDKHMLMKYFVGREIEEIIFRIGLKISDLSEGGQVNEGGHGSTPRENESQPGREGAAHSEGVHDEQDRSSQLRAL